MFITDADDLNHAILYCLIKLSIFTGIFFAILIWLFQPIVIENPGIAVYQSPPGTRLLPLTRKSAELTEIQPARNLAVAQYKENAFSEVAVKKSSTRIAKLKPLRGIVPPSWYGERAYAYERQFRDNGDRYRPWF